MRRFGILLLLLAIVSCCLFAASGEVLPFGSGIYEDMDRLFVMAGCPIPSSSRPWTKAEARNELGKLDVDSLNVSLRLLYDSISEYLDEKSSYAINVDVKLSPEVYLHTNRDYDREEMWLVNYLDRAPFLQGDFDAYCGGFSFHTELSFGVSRIPASDTIRTVGDYCGPGVILEYFPDYLSFMDRPYSLKSERYSSNLSTNFATLGDSEVQVPRFSWLTYAWDNGSIGFYKAKKEWGKTFIGNYIYDSHVASYDYVSAKFFNQKFSFDFTVMAPDSYLGGSANTYSIEYQRLFLSHRLQVQPTRNLSIAFSENIMYWLEDGVELSFLNPSYLYHSNVENNLMNALAHVEIEYVPIKGLRVYSQFGVDQGSVPFFEDASKEDQAMGFTFGTQYYFEFLEGCSDVNLEVAYVTPAMYRRGGQHPDFILADLVIVNDSNYSMVPVLTYMGFPYGGDTFATRIGFDYWEGDLTINSYAMVLLKGGFSLFTKNIGRTGMSLTENISSYYVCDTQVAFSPIVGKGINCKAYANIGFLYSGEYGMDAQLTVGLSFEIGARVLCQ